MKAQYKCTHCKRGRPPGKFSKDKRRKNRDFLCNWCKDCVTTDSNRRRTKKRAAKKVEQEQAKIEYAVDHPVPELFEYGNFSARDAGDDGIVFRIDNPILSDEMLAQELPPEAAHNLRNWIGHSNKGKLKVVV
ncbi:unnamed protein product [marine sediment metagenome]|uniref:Uncharacterized protein n=1 Tax=marine sediment metagenome TaxID=412755 RepID=X0XD02_9ZZZZ